MPESGVTEPTPVLLDELQQDPVALPAVPVRVLDAVETYALPARYVQYATDLVGDAYVQVLPLNIKRARVTVLATGQPFTVSDTSTGGGADWPINVPLVLANTRPLYVKSGTPGTPSRLTTIVEIWAD